MLGEFNSADKTRKNEIKEARKSMTLDLKGASSDPPQRRLSLFEAVPAPDSFRRSVSVNDMVGLAMINRSEPPKLAWPGCAYFYSGGYGTLAQSKSSHQLTLLHNLPLSSPSFDMVSSANIYKYSMNNHSLIEISLFISLIEIFLSIGAS